METWEVIVKCAETAYKSVYGLEKWNSLTAQQKHDAVMIMLTNLYSALG